MNEKVAEVGTLVHIIPLPAAIALFTIDFATNLSENRHSYNDNCYTIRRQTA